MVIAGKAPPADRRTHRKGLTDPRAFPRPGKRQRAGVFTVNGFSFAGRARTAAWLHPACRGVNDGQRQRAQSIAARAMGAFAAYRDGLIFAITARRAGTGQCHRLRPATAGRQASVMPGCYRCAT
jgi:HAE1 family hydrophobic/amphiphilic exporter-1/multidrug efflux pump